MGNNPKLTAEYFPHYAAQGNTVFILKSMFGLEGYAMWYQLLELLCLAKGHFIDVNLYTEMELMYARIGIMHTKGELILHKLAERGNIDAELWKCSKIIWCQDLVDNLSRLYDRRTDKPKKPTCIHKCDSCIHKCDSCNINPIDVNILTQSKVKDSKVKNKELCKSPTDDILIPDDHEKPEKPKSDKKYKLRSLAVVRYQEITGTWPNKVQMDAIDENVLTDADLDTWEIVIKAWLMRGFSPVGVKGMLEWFKDGIPSKKGFTQVQPSQQASESDIDEWDKIASGHK